MKTVYCSNVETHGTGISVYFCTKERDASFIPSDGINIDIPVEDFGKTLTYPGDNFDGAGWSFYVEGVGIYSDVKIDYDYNFTNGSLTTSEIETGKPISISFSGTNTNGDTVTIEYQGTPIWIDRYPTGMISDDD